MEDQIFQITSKFVTIEITDEKTGKIFRRELPIDYFENANGIRLQGENLDGSSCQLVFYSARGLERLQGLTGKGPDEDPCGSHKQEHPTNIF